jgi:hypothetical protein
MSFTWQLEDADGTVRDHPSAPTHANQSDAESWLGEQWRSLAAAGVAQVSLFDGTERVYGPMPLSET